MRMVVTETSPWGDIYEARREGNDYPWTISHPYGDERLYGTVPEIRARIRELIATHKESGADLK